MHLDQVAFERGGARTHAPYQVGFATFQASAVALGYYEIFFWLQIFLSQKVPDVV